MEAFADGPGVTAALGRLHARERSHARAQPHSRGALVGGTGRGQKARPAQLHRSLAQTVSLRRSTEAGSGAAGARAPRTLFAPGGTGGNAGARALLTGRCRTHLAVRPAHDHAPV